MRTLGHVETVLKPEYMLPLAGVLEHLVDADSPESQYVRRRLVEELDDTCDMAYRQFRERAQETIESDTEHDRQVDGYEKNPLNRPAFKVLDDTQASALDSLWSGFADREALGRWVRSLSAPTNGEKPERLLERIISSPVMLEALLDEASSESVALRYRFAVGIIMPSFFSAARSLNGSERSEVQTDTNHGEFQQG
ncbi:hypothetical protein [Halorubrum salinum]|uniref:hypothetical protein n=1 Tax=Halorubrum salinum TaxID=767517 RepID=UPI002111A939|nr:hypothetical protein [Halorubrum salinum]